MGPHRLPANIQLGHHILARLTKFSVLKSFLFAVFYFLQHSSVYSTGARCLSLPRRQGTWYESCLVFSQLTAFVVCSSSTVADGLTYQTKNHENVSELSAKHVTVCTDTTTFTRWLLLLPNSLCNVVHLRNHYGTYRQQIRSSFPKFTTIIFRTNFKS